MFAQLLCGSALAILPTLASGMARCCITSPPYFGMRDYGIEAEDWPEVEYVPLAGLPPVVIPAMRCTLGGEADPLAYVGHLVLVFREVRRVLSSDGTLWLNLGDSFCSTDKRGGGVGGNTGKHTAAQDGTSPSWAVRKKHKPIHGMKPKDLFGIPWRAAYALQADGWWLRADCVWEKPNAMPESSKDRPTRSHEYLFLLARSSRYFYDNEAVREAPVGYTRKGGSATYTAEGFTTNGVGSRTLHQLNPAGRNRRSVWAIPTKSYKGAHFAVMPEKLVEPCVLAGSAPDDIVLDPFVGSGTVVAVAQRLGRTGIGIDAKASYLDLARERL